jgi:hypothetical protein
MELFVALVALALIGFWVFHMWRLARRRSDIWKGRGAWKEPESDPQPVTLEQKREEDRWFYSPAGPRLADAGSGVEVVPDAGVGPRRLTAFQDWVFPLPDGLPMADLPSGPEETSEVPRHVQEVPSSSSEPDQQGSISTTGLWQIGGSGGKGHGSH